MIKEEAQAKGTLSIVATPIGNLEDITLRAIITLNEVDSILAEDTRVAKKLTNHFEITTKIEPFHHHSKEGAYISVINRLKEGAHLALITDAGTPGVSDPGNKLIKEVYDSLGDIVRIEPIPGPSSLTAALSIAGISTDRFNFYGFLPHKKGRETLLKEIASSKTVSIFFESPHRILKALTSLEGLLESDRPVIVGRELTKKFETIYRGSIKDVRSRVEEKVKGEFVIIIGV